MHAHGRDRALAHVDEHQLRAGAGARDQQADAEEAPQQRGAVRAAGQGGVDDRQHCDVGEAGNRAGQQIEDQQPARVAQEVGHEFESAEETGVGCHRAL